MTEVLFYHLTRRTLEDALPALVERTLAHGWKAFVRTESDERAQTIDRLLWTYDEASFLPHGLSTEPAPARQPVLIGTDEGVANGAEVLFLVGGAPAPDWTGALAKGLVRIVVMFDGRDPAAVESAREAWKASKRAGHEITYWKETPAGKWEKEG